MWTTEEDTLIREAVQQRGPKWQKIAVELPGRSANALRSRYRRCLAVASGAAAASGAYDSDEGERVPRLWVACDRCDKWRRLPAELSGKRPTRLDTVDRTSSAPLIARWLLGKLPTTWYCWMHPDPARRRCETPEEEARSSRDPAVIWVDVWDEIWPRCSPRSDREGDGL